MDWLISLFTWFSLLMGNELVFAVSMGSIVLFAERRQKKRMKLVLGVLVLVILLILLKSYFGVSRPCEGMETGYGCPDFPFFEYSFPSAHAAAAFLIMVAFLDKPSFPFFWIFALFVSASRLFLGVHTFEDIAGSLALAPIAYYITDSLWGRYFA